ncbi:MAG: FAD-dependent oxidoreductase, partial [Armatimonadota bacterium]
MKTPQNIVVLGGGFAGLWSALGAARQRDESGLGPEDMEITLVSRDPWHAIRVRNYEADISDARLPLDTVLDPVRVRRIEGEVIALSPHSRTVSVQTATDTQTLSYDRLVFALGSRLRRPFLPGLAAYAFDVDTYVGAERLGEHLRSLSVRPAT